MIKLQTLELVQGTIQDLILNNITIDWSYTANRQNNKIYINFVSLTKARNHRWIASAIH
jgi:hypothetical protein